MQKLLIWVFLSSVHSIECMQDVAKHIAKWVEVAHKAEQASGTQHEVSESQKETLVIPTTFCVKPVKLCTSYYIRPEDIINPEPHTKVLPHIQSFFRKYKSYVGLRLDRDLDLVEDMHTFPLDHEIDTAQFDMNNHQTAVMGFNTESGFTLYKLILSFPNKWAIEIEPGKREVTSHLHASPTILIQEDGTLNALTLDQEQNRILYSQAINDQSFISIKDIGLTKQIDIKHLAPVYFKKIVDLGNTTTGKEKKWGNIYLGLTPKGQLFSFWLDENNKMRYASQKCPSQLTNIAVDHKRKHGDFKPHLALLDDKGNVGFVNLLCSGTPIILWRRNATDTQAINQNDTISCSIEESVDCAQESIDYANALGFYYNNGSCSLVMPKTFHVWPENSSLFHTAGILSNIDISSINTLQEDSVIVDHNTPLINTDLYKHYKKILNTKNNVDDIKDEDLFDAARYGREMGHPNYTIIAHHLINRLGEEKNIEILMDESPTEKNTFTVTVSPDNAIQYTHIKGNWAWNYVLKENNCADLLAQATTLDELKKLLKKQEITQVYIRKNNELVCEGKDFGHSFEITKFATTTGEEKNLEIPQTTVDLPPTPTSTPSRSIFSTLWTARRFIITPASWVFSWIKWW